MWIAAAIAGPAANVRIARGQEGVRPGDAATATVPESPTPFARYIPASAGVFITIRDLGEVDRALTEAHAARWLALVQGAEAGSNRRLDLPTAIRGFLSPDSTIDVADLMKTEVAVVADDWSGLANAVWFVRLTDPNLPERWFPPSSRSHESRPNQALFFASGPDIVVAIRDDVMAMGRRTMESAMLRETMQLMSGIGGETLEGDGDHRALHADLPGDWLARAHLSADVLGSATPLPVGVTRAAIGMDEVDGRIELAIRAAVDVSRPRRAASASAVRRMELLPADTLLAYAMSFDLDEALSNLAERSGAGAGRYLSLLSSLAHSEGGGGDMFDALGDQIVFGWARNPSKAPRAAVLIECVDASAARSETERLVGNVLRIVEKIDTTPAGARPRLEHVDHAGTPMAVVSWREYANESRFRLMRLLAGVTPCFAVADGWLVVALDPDHLRRIIDAAAGRAAKLSTSSKRAPRDDSSAHGSLVFHAHPSRAAAVVAEWIARFEAGQPSLLDPAQWQTRPPRRDGKMRQIGIGMKRRQSPGAVVVARVYPDTIADGRLQVGDRILGVDGEVLSIDRPNADLRKRLMAPTDPRTVVLRVLRDEALIEVPIDIAPPPPAEQPDATALVDALRELGALGRSLDTVQYFEETPGDAIFRARLTLTFDRSEAVRSTAASAPTETD